MGARGLPATADLEFREIPCNAYCGMETTEEIRELQEENDELREMLRGSIAACTDLRTQRDDLMQLLVRELEEKDA